MRGRAGFVVSGPGVEELVPSFVLEVGGFEVRPTWPAPWFVLVIDEADEPAAPLLVHCESLDHANRHRGILLDAAGRQHVRVP